MESGLNTYVQIVFDIIVGAIIAVVLFYIGSRFKKEKSSFGFSASSQSEKYFGYGLLACGIVVIAVSVIELIVLLTSGFDSVPLFRLSSITFGTGFSISGQILGTIVGVSFWLIIFGFCGNKFISLGLDLLRGRSIRLRRPIKT